MNIRKTKKGVEITSKSPMLFLFAVVFALALIIDVAVFLVFN